jgi:hypothetical protein
VDSRFRIGKKSETGSRENPERWVSANESDRSPHIFKKVLGRFAIEVLKSGDNVIVQLLTPNLFR